MPKPHYTIRNAVICGARNVRWLMGEIQDHPNCTNGSVQRTSNIICWDVECNVIETQNSVYHVESWQKD